MIQPKDNLIKTEPFDFVNLFPKSFFKQFLVDSFTDLLDLAIIVKQNIVWLGWGFFDEG